MKSPIIPWILIGCMITFAIVEFPQWQAGRHAEKGELKAIKLERDSLAILLRMSARREKYLKHSIYNSVKDNKRLRGLNEASNTRIEQWKQRSKHYEKALFDILNYTDAVMDSLYRSRYPQTDSVYQLRTAPGVD